MSVDVRTLSEQIYQTLRTEILTSALLPGEDLSEVAIAERLGTSRGPVREAMRRLEAEGLVEVRPRRGAVVAKLSRQEFLEAYKVRGALEVLAIREGIFLGTPGILKKIRDLIDQMEVHAEKGEEDAFFIVNRQLHHELCALARNETLLNIYERLMNRMERYSHRSALVRGNLASSVDEHRAILDAIERGDAEEAGRLTDAHIGVPLRLVEQITDEDWENLG